MDLHRLRVVEFDKLVSEKQGKKKNISNLEERTQEECKTSCNDGKNNETIELERDKKRLGDNSSSPETSKKSSFVGLKSKSEIFRIPPTNKLLKQKVKNIISSSIDLTEPFGDSVNSIQKKRNLTLFKRKPKVNKKEGDVKKSTAKHPKDKRKDKNEGDIKTMKDKNEEVNFLFPHNTPSFLRYSKKRAKKEGTKKNHDPQLPINIFGFRNNNRFVDPYLYQLTCKKYMNTDKLPFKKIRKGFRHKLKPSQLVIDNFCKHHGMRVLTSGVKSTDTEFPNSRSIYYNLNNHSHSRRIRPVRDYSLYEDIWGQDPSTFYLGKDQNVAVSPSSLLPITTCCIDTSAGPSKVELTSCSPPRPCRSPGTPSNASPAFQAQQKPPCSRQQKPYSQHSTPGPSTASSCNVTNGPARSKSILEMCKEKRNDTKKWYSIITSQRKATFTRFFQKVTTFHLKPRPAISGKNCIKYAFFGLLIVVWSPCLLAVILAWVIMCPVRITSILTTDKTNRSFPIMNSFMKRVRKKCSGSVYHRMCFEYYPWHNKRDLLTSVASWYARVAGTVVQSFKAMISLLKLNKNKPSKCARSSFLPKIHPNPRRRYTLFYADNRGWMMKPRRSHTRSCASTRVVQSMRCDVRPAFCQKSNYDQNTKSGSSQCPEQGFRSFKKKLKRSPAEEAVAVCDDVEMSYSGDVITHSKCRNARNKTRGSAMFMPVTTHLSRKQVNIPPIFCYPVSTITPDLTKYHPVKNNKKLKKSVNIANMSPNDFDKYHFSHRKNGTLPFGMMLDCPCGTKHPVIKNRETSRTHKFALAGKDLKMTTKLSSIFKVKGAQGRSTKNETSKTKINNILRTYRTGLSNITRNKSSSKFSTSRKHKTRTRRVITECELALKCNCKPTITDRKTVTKKNKKPIPKGRTRNKGVLADMSRSALTNQAGTSTFQIDLADKTQTTSKRVIDIALNCPCKPSKSSKQRILKGSVPSRSSNDLSCETDKIVKHDKDTHVEKNSLSKFPPKQENKLRKQSASKVKKTFKCACNVPSTKDVAKQTKQINKAIDCGCETEKQTARTLPGPPSKQKASPSQCACKNGPSITKVNPKQTALSETEKQTTTTMTKHPSKQQASECACKTIPSIRKETVQPEQTLSPKGTIDCACETKKQTKLTESEHPPKQQASQCACKAVQSTTKDTIHPKTTVPLKKAIDCGCGTEKQTKSTLAEHPLKPQVCPCDGPPCKSKETVIPKEMRLGKKTIDCSCGTEEQTKTTVPELSSKQQAAQCACKEVQTTTTETVQPKPIVSAKKTIDCSCGTENLTKTTVPAHPSKQQASQCACKNVPSISKDAVDPKQTVPSKKPIGCSCVTEKQTKATLREHPLKPQVCPCDGPPCKTKETVIPKEIRLAKKMVHCSCGTEKPTKTTLPELSSKQQASQCACKNAPSFTKDTVDTKQIVPSKKSIQCACKADGTENQKKATQSKHPSKQKALECACKYEPEILKESVNPKQTMLAKKTIDCGCGTEKQTITTKSEQVTSCPCEGPPCKTKEMVHSKAKQTVDCGCGKEKQKKTLTLDHETEKGPKSKVSQCACKDVPTTTKETLQQNKTVSPKKIIQCGCEAKKEKNTILPDHTSKKQASQCACKNVPSTKEKVHPKQTAPFKLAIDCACGTEKPTKPTLPEQNKKEGSKHQTSQCACKEVPTTTKDTVQPKQKVSKNTTLPDHPSGQQTSHLIMKNAAATSKNKAGPIKQTVSYKKELSCVSGCTCELSTGRKKEIYLTSVITPTSSTINAQNLTLKKRSPRLYWDSLWKRTQSIKYRQKKKKTDCTCGIEKQTKTTLSEHPFLNQQASQCPCDGPPCKTKETVEPKQNLSAKKTLVCGCGTERQTKTSLQDQGRKQVSKSEASQCACKHDPSTTEEMDQSKVTLSSKEMIKCDCSVENQIRTTVSEQPPKPHASQCACKNAKDTIHSKPTASFKTAIDCGCEAAKPTESALPEHPSRQNLSECACKNVKIASNGKTEPIKQNLSYKKELPCVSGCTCELSSHRKKEINLNSVTTLNSSTTNASKLTPKKLSPRLYWDSLWKKTQSSKFGMGKSKNYCGCGTKTNPKATEAKHPAKQQARGDHNIYTQCNIPSFSHLCKYKKKTPITKAREALSLEDNTYSESLKHLSLKVNTSKEQSLKPTESRIAIHCSCEAKHQNKIVDNKKAVDTFVIQSDSIGQCNQENSSSIKKKKHNIVSTQYPSKEACFAGYLTNIPSGVVASQQRSLIQSSSHLVTQGKPSKQISNEPAASNCPCGLLNQNCISNREKISINTHKTNYIEKSHSHQKKSLQPNSSNNQFSSGIADCSSGITTDMSVIKTESAFRIAKDCPCGVIAATEGGHGTCLSQYTYNYLGKSQVSKKNNLGSNKNKKPHKISSGSQTNKPDRKPAENSQKRSIGFGLTDLVKKAGKCYHKKTQISQTPHKRSLCTIKSDYRSIKCHHGQQHPYLGEKASQTKSISFHKSTKCPCKYDSCIESCKKRAIDCICRTKKQDQNECPHSHQPHIIGDVTSATLSRQVLYSQKESKETGNCPCSLYVSQNSLLHKNCLCSVDKVAVIIPPSFQKRPDNILRTHSRTDKSSQYDTTTKRHLGRVSRVVKKIRSKLFSYKISKQTQLSHKKPIIIYSSSSKYPSPVKHISSYQRKLRKCRCPVDNISLKFSSDRNSWNTYKSLLEKSQVNLSGGSQKSKASQPSFFSTHSCHSIFHSRCRCLVIKPPSKLEHSNSTFSTRRITHNFKMSQHPFLSSRSNELKRRCLVGITSSSQLGSSGHTFQPKLSQRHKSSQYSSTRSSFFCSTQSKQLTEKLRYITDKISQHSHKQGRAKISSLNVKTSTIIPAKCACLSAKNNQHLEKLSQNSRKSVLEGIPSKPHLSGYHLTSDATPIAAAAEFQHNISSHESKSLHQFSSLSTASTEKQRFLCDHLPPPPRNFEPISIISSKGTCKTNNHRNAPEENTNHLKRYNVSDYSNKIGLAEKLYEISQNITIQRSEISQCPQIHQITTQNQQNPQVPQKPEKPDSSSPVKLLSALKRFSCECGSIHPQAINSPTDKISHVSRKAEPAGKPPSHVSDKAEPSNKPPSHVSRKVEPADKPLSHLSRNADPVDKSPPGLSQPRSSRKIVKDPADSPSDKISHVSRKAQLIDKPRPGLSQSLTSRKMVKDPVDNPPDNPPDKMSHMSRNAEPIDKPLPGLSQPHSSRKILKDPAVSPPDKISHVSPKAEPVDKPPPGLLQRRSSRKNEKDSADNGVRKRHLSQPAIPQQYPDFNRVSMRYPGKIGHKRSEKNAAPILTEQIPYPANYYPPAVGGLPLPNYERYPCYINPANKCGPKSCYDEWALRRAYKRRPLRFTPPKEQKKIKKEINTKEKKFKGKIPDKQKKKSHNDSNKTKYRKKRSGNRLSQCIQCFQELVYEAEKDAWPEDITCRPMYIHTLKRKPCFWVFNWCPSMYPAVLTFIKFQENICKMFMYVLSICFWCPFIFCVYICCSLICGSGQ